MKIVKETESNNKQCTKFSSMSVRTDHDSGVVGFVIPLVTLISYINSTMFLILKELKKNDIKTYL